MSINNVEHSDELKMLAPDTKKRVIKTVQHVIIVHVPAFQAHFIYMQTFALTLTFECLS